MVFRMKFSKAEFLGILLVLLLEVFLLAAGCGNDKVDGTGVLVDEVDLNGEAESQFPLVITDSAERKVLFAESPKRIATVIPADMEIIYALGGEVVGRPQKSFGEVRPPEAAAAEEIGRPQIINFEKIAALETDLFIGHKRLNAKDVPTLESLGMNVLLTQGDSVEEIIDLIEMYGRILNKEAAAKGLIYDIEIEIEKISSGFEDKNLKALILYGTPSETMAALPKSLAGNMFELVGIQNIYQDMPGLKTYPTYAQLSLERILEADPDVIYFMFMGDDEKPFEQFQAEMALIPAWNELTAIRNDRLVVLPYELFGTNPGPRIVESLHFLQDSLKNLNY